MARRPRRWLQWARRTSQGVCLLGFCVLVLGTALSDEARRTLFTPLAAMDPLLAGATTLAAREAVGVFVLAFFTLAMTLILGRVFCGWVCPFGAVHTLAGAIRRRVPRPHAPERRSGWQRGKYALLAALFVMALFGANWAGLFDPLSLMYRSVTVALLPAVQYAVEDGSTAIYRAEPGLGPLRVTAVSEPVYEFLRDHVFVRPGQAFLGAFVIGLLFTAAVVLNAVKPRFWCRYVCPLGGLLGLFSQRPALRLENDARHCNDCGRCNLACPAAAQPDVRGGWLPTECYVCYNCVAACNLGAIRFRFEPPHRRTHAGAIDFPRRTLLAAGGSGLAALLLLRLTPKAQGEVHAAELVRPPGALGEDAFQATCIQCGACMRACPTSGLQPCGFEAGIEGLWSPRLVPQIGYCEYNCNRCGYVCPTGAIQPLKLAEKQETKIGLASFDTGRCIPYAYGRDCAVCEEHCPVPDKAIYFVRTEITTRDGMTTVINQPRVDADKCIGCGNCEWSCVLKDKPAIRVTSANEARHPENQPILPGGASESYNF